MELTYSIKFGQKLVKKWVEKSLRISRMKGGKNG